MTWPSNTSDGRVRTRSTRVRLIRLDYMSAHYLLCGTCRCELGRVIQGETGSLGSLFEKGRTSPEVNTELCLSSRNLYRAKHYRERSEGQKSRRGVTEVTVPQPN